MTLDNISKPIIQYKPIVLIILDGWGLSSNWSGNAISMAKPANFESWWRDYPHTVLQAFRIISGQKKVVSSSEIGHACIGSGRMIEQDSQEISEAISSKDFFANETFLAACENVKKNNTSLHLIGLVSDGGVHSELEHLFALLELAKKEQVRRVFIDVITDGVDSEKKSAILYIEELSKKITELGIGKIATICGRFYAMDRDNNLERTQIAYEAQTLAHGKYFSNARDAIDYAYQAELTDDFIPAYIMTDGNNQPIGQIKDHDSVIFFNFRGDRLKQSIRFYTDKNYLKKFIFWRKYPILNIYLATMTDYSFVNPLVHVAYKSAVIDETLAKIISDHGLHQLHIAESEKFPHVSYFFNGGKIEPYAEEKRIMIPSRKIKSYAQFPQMSARQITESINSAVKTKKFDFIVANYANLDSVAHTGDINAVIKAVKIVDEEIKKVAGTVIKSGGAVIITADHGNAEQMIQANTVNLSNFHSLNPVPFIFLTARNKKNLMMSALTPTNDILDEILHSNNSLADIAPTILELFGIAKPTEMTGNSLLNKLK